MDDHGDAVFGIGEAEEGRLLRRIARGEKRAEQRLLEAYEPLLAAAVRRWAKPSDANYHDLRQQGIIGLLRAARRFDASKGVRFGAYAQLWVEGAIKDAFAPADWEQSGLVAEELEDQAGDEDDLALASTSRPRRRRARHLGEFVGGTQSGRDAYLMHYAAADAEVRAQFEKWLAERRGWTLLTRGWNYLVAAEPELLAQARRGETAALARLEQKYSLLQDKLGLHERDHAAKELRIGPDRRSQALAVLIALAVAKGSLPELEWRAGQRPAVPPGFAEVAAFRRRHLGGELLAADQVVAWVEEQAYREGPPAAAYLRVPLAEEELESLGELALAGSAPAYADWLEHTAKRVREEDMVELPEAHPQPPRALLYGSAEAPQIVRIRGDGALAELKVVVSNLLAHFDGWLEEEALAFILCGTVPPLDKLRARTRQGLYRAASRITLDCDPRTAPADVAAFYEQLRRRYLKGRDRVMAEKGLALAVFAEEHWRPDRSWSDLQKLWNSAHPAGDPLHSAVSRNQFQTECRVSWERLTGELWPGGKRAKRKLKDDVAAARKRAQARQAQPT